MTKRCIRGPLLQPSFFASRGGRRRRETAESLRSMSDASISLKRMRGICFHSLACSASICPDYIHEILVAGRSTPPQPQPQPQPTTTPSLRAAPQCSSETQRYAAPAARRGWTTDLLINDVPPRRRCGAGCGAWGAVAFFGHGNPNPFWLSFGLGARGAGQSRNLSESTLS